MNDSEAIPADDDPRSIRAIGSRTVVNDDLRGMIRIFISYVSNCLNIINLKRAVKYKTWRGNVPVMHLCWICASFLVCIAGCNEQPGEKASAETSKTNDVPPGVSKATLTLSDGGKIILDRSANATVTDGKLQLKNANGQVDYSGATYHATHTLSTPRGGQFQVKFADGSQAWLDAASSITYPTTFTGHERAVAITGQVYFEIVRNDKHPFSITVKDVGVRISGTMLNINAYGDDGQIRISLLQGSASVTSGIALEKLKTGQQAQITRDGSLEVVTPANIVSETAWKNGQFSFDNQSLETSLRQISRWYDVIAIFEGNKPKIQLTGTTNKNVPLSELLYALKSMGLRTRIDSGKKLIVLE